MNLFKYYPFFLICMPEEPFMLVSLEEAKAKKLAQVLNNETCTKLLNYLSSHKEATESELAKKLKLPLSTVHYNLKQLVEAKLVIADEYHYSAKGREVNHYKIANKYIIIAPQEDQKGFLNKLKGFIPVTLIAVGTAVVLKVLSVINGAYTTNDLAAAPQADFARAQPMLAKEEAMLDTMEAGAMFADEAVNETINTTIPASPPSAMPYPEPSTQSLFSNELILAFLVGAVFAIGVLILFSYWKYKKNR